MNQKSNNISKNILRIMPRQNIAHIPPPSSEHSSLWHQWMPQTITSQLNTSRQEIPWWLVSMINDLWFLERSILDWGWGTIRIIIISAIIIGSTEISKKTMEQGYKAKCYWFIRDLNRELLACVSLNAIKKKWSKIYTTQQSIVEQTDELSGRTDIAVNHPRTPTVYPGKECFTCSYFMPRIVLTLL